MLIFHPTFSHGRVVEEGRQATNVTVFTVEQLAAREIRVRMCFFIAFFLAVQDSSISDIVCRSLGPLVGAN